MDEGEFLDLFYKVEILKEGSEEEEQELARFVGPLDELISHLDGQKIERIRAMPPVQRESLRQVYAANLSARTAKEALLREYPGEQVSRDVFDKAYLFAKDYANTLSDQFFASIAYTSEDPERMFQ